MKISDADLNFLIPVFVFVVWYAMLALIALVGGWSALASFYAGDASDARWKSHFQTLRLSRYGVPSAYRNGITIGVAGDALLLSPFFTFRPGHPPLRIPFTDLSARQKKSFLINVVELTASQAPKIKISMSPRCAAKIAAASGGVFKIEA